MSNRDDDDIIIHNNRSPSTSVTLTHAQYVTVVNAYAAMVSSTDPLLIQLKSVE